MCERAIWMNWFIMVLVNKALCEEKNPESERRRGHFGKFGLLRGESRRPLVAHESPASHQPHAKKDA